MKIGLYFGSFNPIHTGHLIIAEYALSHADIQQVWFVVSPQNPQKSKGSLLDEYTRLHFVNLSIENNSKFRASNLEFKLSKPSYTINTITYLEEKYPQHIFSIIIGSDSFLNLESWKNYDTLIKKVKFYIYPRPSFEIEEETINKNIKYKILKDVPQLYISATYIRNCIKERKSIRYLVHDDVYQEIQTNMYYF